MTLVSFEDAKHHLRKTSDEEDSDILLKLDQASAIVLTHVKTWLTAVASVSVANPTVITTSVPHCLISGVSVTIADTTTTPTINGVQVVTVTSPTTFTVPVNVTVGQSTTAGTASSPAWTDVTATGNMGAAVLSVLEDLYERRPIDYGNVTRLLEGIRIPTLA